MHSGVESRSLSQEPKKDEPKPVTYTVFVDTRMSIEELCGKAGFALDLDPSKLGEWPNGSYNKGKTKGHVLPYGAELTDGSDTVGKTWEKAMAGKTKEQKGASLLEGIELVKEHPEILDQRRLVLPATSFGLYEVVQIEKVEGKVVISPLFVGDTNTDHKIKEPEGQKKLPFAVIFANSRTPLAPGM